MHRELFSHPHIASYSAFLLIGLFGGYLLARWRAGRVGIKRSHLDNLILLIAVMSLFGARFFSWLFYFPPGVSFWRALTSSSGGMVFYGGLIFGIAAVMIYARAARLSLANLFDVCAAPVALGLAFGRIGCFMAGCCWGDLCVSDAEAARLPSSDVAWQVRSFSWLSQEGFPLAVRFPADASATRQHQELGLVGANAARSLPVHPVQLYEAGLSLVLCLVLNGLFSRRRWPGQVAVWLSLGYAGIRFGTEFLRADNTPSYFGMTLSQVISVVIAAVAVAFVLWRQANSALDTAASMPLPSRISDP